MSKTGIIESDGRKIRYAEFGCGKKTFIILPGLSVKSVIDSAAVIKIQYAIFEKDYTVYVIDRNENVSGNYSAEKVAEDVLLCMDKLGIDKADFFGASFGGMVAECIAAKYPERIERLVLGSTCARRIEGSSRAIDLWIALAEKGKRGLLLKQFAAGLYSEKFLEKNADFLDFSGDGITDEELNRFIIYAKCAKNFNIYDDLDKIKCETLIIGAKNDKVIPIAAAEELFDKIKKSELYIYNEYGHSVFDEAPDYQERILNFLSKKRD